ncbi:histone-arginine methyltransferase CARMER-like [Actinia tenebrosa]|uniref:type I protein arginine methyltransferase n=1 Tax=Actinia tenebrosa TaxID=6105 RepID=A0A6P8ICR5_ACTTE|nr:histone-arginine methyltransferase CARMER-like [Actinia tenebrosa]
MEARADGNYLSLIESCYIPIISMDHPMHSRSDTILRSFIECSLKIMKGESSLVIHEAGECTIDVRQEPSSKNCDVQVRCGSEFSPHFRVCADTNHSQVGRLRYLIDLPEHCCSIIITFSRNEEVKEFRTLLSQSKARSESESTFNERTDEASAMQYFQFYGYLSQQQNMMQDYTRTSTYQKAMLQNHVDFEDKVVIDVGAGSGILSFFAVQAGARKVYAIEASSMAMHAELLVKKNNLEDKIIVVPGKVEEVHIPEKVDAIISEPMGYMLFNERMLESYLHAKKWLKPGGKMFPSVGQLHVAPFSDDALYIEHFSKANFWYQKSFYGVDLSSLREAALKEYFKQPVVDTFDERILMAKPVTYSVDFLTSEEDDLHRMEIPIKFTLLSSGSLHGLAFWFDVCFKGSQVPVWLSTAPHEPLTHWYQVRCLLETPIFVKAGQSVSGTVLLVSNARQSYDVDFEIRLDGTTIRTRNTVDLKNPYFRYTGSTPQPPAGYNNESPTEVYWSLASNGDSSHTANAVNSNAVGGGGGSGCSPSVMMGESMTNTTGMHSNSLYNNTGGYVGGQYWGGNAYGNVTSLQAMQNYSGSFGAINNVNTSYIASSQPAMLYSQTSGRNAVMTGQNQRH